MRHRLFHRDTAFLWAVLLTCLVPFFPEYCAPLLAIGSVIAAAYDARARQAAIQIGTLGKVLLIYIVYMIIGIIYSDHPLNSLSTAAMWAVMFGSYLSLSTVICNRHRLHAVLFVIALVAAAIGLISGIQYLLLQRYGTIIPNQLWLPLDELFYRYFPLNIDLHMADHRPCGTFNNPNILGEYLVMVLPFIGYYGFSEFRTRRSLLARACLFVAVLGIASSMSRGAYLAVLAMVLLVFLFNLRFKRITPLALCAVAAVSLLPEAVTGRFLSIGQGSSDFAIFERFETWGIAIETIVKHPLFGLGPGISNFWDRLQATGVTTPHSHNLVLQVMVEGGFIALFLLCSIALKILQNSLELANRRRRGNSLGNALIIFVVAFVVYGMVDYPFLSPKLVGVFLTVIGLSEAIFRIYLRQPTLSLRALPSTLVHSARRALQKALRRSQRRKN